MERDFVGYIRTYVYRFSDICLLFLLILPGHTQDYIVLLLMNFEEFAGFLSELEGTTKRLEITDILARLIKASSVTEIDKVLFLSLGTLAPNYEGVLLNLAEKMSIRVLAQAYGVSEEKIKADYKKAGDIGVLAENLAKNNKNTSNTSVTQVFETLLGIAGDNGEGSQERKVEKLSNLLKNLGPLSVRFVSRFPTGNLRLGFSEKTVVDALSKASGIEAVKIEAAYNIRPDIGYVAKLVKEGNLQSAKPTLGVPVVPMLAQRLNSTSEMIKKMGRVSVEPKFDGLRIFIHFRKRHPSTSSGQDFLKIFTRNMNSIEVETFPELKNVGDFIKADEIILDTEAIGIDEKREKFLDFQKTIQRRRKHDVEKNAEEIPLQFQVFDLIYADGKSYMDVTYLDRREALKKYVVNGKLLRIDENTVTEDPELIKNLHQKYLNMNLEGVVVKKAEGKYVSGRTGWNWVKMKEEEGRQGKLSDTIDCVVMGYTAGKGKRAGFGVGQFLAGIKEGDIFKTVTKVGTGLTDDQFKELNSRLEKIVSEKMPPDYEVDKALTPDKWVLPKVVVELAADEITVSPNHTSGYALRFPRLIKFRDDKSPKDATTAKEVLAIMKLQKK